MSGSAIVLGSRPGSGNIGDAISRALRGRGWIVTDDDCKRIGEIGAEVYSPPYEDLSQYHACIITLGMTKLTPLRASSQSDIDEVIHASLTLPLQCAHKYVGDRITGGRIIFVGSYAHDHVLTNCTAYCAAKAGLAHAVEEMGWQLTPDFYTYIIHPYHVPSTPMGQEVVKGMVENRGMTIAEAEDYQRKDLKLPRHQRPADIAKVVTWLLSHDTVTPWLSGQGINLYGGVR